MTTNASCFACVYQLSVVFSRDPRARGFVAFRLACADGSRRALQRCDDGRRAPSRIRAVAGRKRYVDLSKGVPRTRGAQLLGGRRPECCMTTEFACWGVQLRLFSALKVLVVSYVRRFWLFHPRFQPHPRVALVPAGPSLPAGWLISTGPTTAQSKLAVEMNPSTGKRRLRWPLAARESERSSSLLLRQQGFVLPNTQSLRIAFANRSVPDDPAQGINQP